MIEREHLNDFVDYQKRMLDRFKDWYMDRHSAGDEPDYYVLCLEHGTWCEEFAVWLDREEAKK